jgi:thermitase
VRSFGIILGLFANPTIDPGRCVDDNGHGTHVAGTIAARANNGRGVTGVAFNSPLAVCKALDASGGGPTAGIANCITYLSQVGAKVISMSLGGTGSTALANAVANASQSAVLVAAAGNSGDATLSYPAGYPQVVSVAATDRNDARASFSTFNADVEIAAPGVDILSTWSDGGYRTLSGTSMSTPHVAGVAAIIAGQSPGAGPAAWRTKLDGAVDHLGSAGRNPQFGFGRVSLAKAVAP